MDGLAESSESPLPKPTSRRGIVSSAKSKRKKVRADNKEAGKYGRSTVKKGKNKIRMPVTPMLQNASRKSRPCLPSS